MCSEKSPPSVCFKRRGPSSFRKIASSLQPASYRDGLKSADLLRLSNLLFAASARLHTPGTHRPSNVNALEKLTSFDEFLQKRFPESRRKAYYLMAIHENLSRDSEATTPGSWLEQSGRADQGRSEKRRRI